MTNRALTPTPVPGPPSAGFALWLTAMRWQRAIDAALRPLKLTHTQFLVLGTAEKCVEHAGEAVSQRTIARAAGLDEVTTSRVAKTLTDKGLLDRGPTFGDGRAWRIIVTAAGRRLLQKAVPRVASAETTFFADEPAAASFKSSTSR